MGVLTGTAGWPFSRQRGGRGGRTSVSLWGSLLLLLVLQGCDHDITVLETHPLDLRGATSASLESFYLTMGDGVEIAVDVYVPEDYPQGGPHPTILEMTRYWRDRGNGIPYSIRRAIQRGFAYVVMDERGTGGSFGSWPAPLTDRALLDAGEVLDWIVAQPWSNGRVGATGISYPGMAAAQLAAFGHPALRAVVPMSDTYDLYEDLVFPGGVFNQAFLQGWSELVSALDRSTSLAVDGETFSQSPVDSDPNGELLDLAIAGHAGNLEIFDAFRSLDYRDELSPGGFSLDDVSTRSRLDAINASGIPVYRWGSWLDAGSADGVIRAFMETTGPRRATIGSWTHGLSENAFTGAGDRWTAIPSFQAQWEEALNFFDDLLRKDKPSDEPVLRYYTMRENLWKATSTWPIPGTAMETLFLDEEEP